MTARSDTHESTDWFDRAKTIAQEHNPAINGDAPLLTRCPDCDGDGEIQHAGESVNPRSGVRGRDPQMDSSSRCTRCDGTGAIEIEQVRS